MKQNRITEAESLHVSVGIAKPTLTGSFGVQCYPLRCSLEYKSWQTASRLCYEKREANISSC